MSRSRCCALLVALLTPTAAAAQSGDDHPAKEMVAARLGPAARIRVDSHLDEPVWREATWRDDFVQKQPVEGGTPSARTEVAFFYDDDALYVGARMFSANPAGVPRTVARRDVFTDAEHLLIVLDTYRDRRTAYSFSISSGGVRGDYFHPSDSEGSRDLAWDPVWQAATSHDSLGWIAEMRIPFSQLRFTAAQLQEWGLQINRWMPNVDEDVYWIMIPSRESGWASRFGALRGLADIKPSRRLEITPYVASSATFSDAAPGDPFNDGSEYGIRAGADLKVGLGSNLTLDATVNPDFGQVEADPAEVNLTAFETFFSERRPFFTEGSRLLTGTGPNYFYSRRIGQSPRGSAQGDFVDRPSNTTILAAAKMSGRLQNGMSIGALTAVTGRETARSFDAASQTFTDVPIEPLTAYGVGRVQQEFGANASTVSATLTAVQRDQEPGSALAALLPNTAVTGGADVNFRTDNNTYAYGASLGFSQLSGEAAAISRIQRAPAHYLQRPDITEATFDSTRTALFGWTANAYAEKNGGDHWVGSVYLGAKSPTFDLNDAGRLNSANDLGTNAQIRYRETEAKGIFHRRNHNFSVGSGWNFGGVRTGTYASLGNRFTFRNFMGLFVGSYLELASQSDTRTRGGPLMATPFTQGFDVSLSSAEGKKTSWKLGTTYEYDKLDGHSVSVSTEFGFRPGSRWRFELEPRWRHSILSRQFVTRIADGPAATYGTRYVFSYVDRTTISTQFRLDYTFSPDLSLEAYAEPFVATGSFRDFGELIAPKTSDLRTYGSDGTTITSTSDGYTVSADGQEFSLPNPDFRVLSFRSNLVLRWEWLPGSTFFVVWQQDRGGALASGRGAGPGALFDAVSAPGSNFLAVKATYWIAPR